MPPTEPELCVLHRWLNCWRGLGDVVTGMNRQGYDLQLTEYDDRGWRDLLHERDGALADERDGHRMGAHAVARDAVGGVGGVGPHTPPIVQVC
jgi:hypothetical protein